MMKIKYTLLVFFALLQISAWSQSPAATGIGGIITGQVIDSLAQIPVEYATITLFPEGSKKGIGGAVTDSKGQFSLRTKSSGYFNISFESIGFKPYTINHVRLDKKGTLHLPKVFLSYQDTHLESVTVTAPSNLVENKIDKMVFNAEKDLTSQGGVATDILKKVPMVSVDVDGNVELAGSSSIRFLINGKPSTAFGSNIADVLQSIPASQIKSIEVITNPGAKYDAEGLGGIINIILKHSSVRGVNGNISLSAGTRRENGSFNLNARRGNFGVNAYVSGNTQLGYTTPSESNRISQDTLAKTTDVLKQDGSSLQRRHGMQTGIGFDWTLRKKNNFSGSLSYDLYGSNGRGTGNQFQSTSAMQGGNPLSQIITSSETDNRFHYHGIDAGLNYKRTFKKEDQDLEIALRTSSGDRDINSNNSQFMMPQDSLYFGTSNDNGGKERETELQVDYRQPLGKKINLGFGGKINLRNISSISNVLSLYPETESYFYDSTLSNHLNYHQKVFALYGEVSLPVSTLFDTKIGGRYERTELDAYFSNAPVQVNQPGYNTFVPSLFFMKKINDQHTFKLSYSKRIHRPDYWDLNPFINTTDPKNISSGNPYLKPEIGNRFELAYNYNMNTAGSIMLAAFYRTSNHDLQSYIVYYPELTVGDSTYTNVAVSTRENIGIQKDAGFNMFGNLHVTDKLDLRTNLFLYERSTINALDPGFDASSFNYQVNMNLSYHFIKSLAGEFFGHFRSPQNEVQGKYPSFTSYSLALRKQFWNKKGSIALTATNPFNLYVNQKTEVYGPDFTINAERRIPYRSFGLNFTWKFGKLDFKKSQDNNTDDDGPGNDG